MKKFTCTEIALAAGLKAGRKSGHEYLYICPRHNDHDPSLSINPAKNVWMCGPCGKAGTAWQLAAFLAGVDPGDKPKVNAWLRAHEL